MAIKVNPNKPDDNTHDFALVGKRFQVGLKLSGEWSTSVDESPQSATNINVGGGGTKFGDWDAFFSHMEISDYLAGGYLKEYDISRSGFRWSKDFWSMQSGRAYPSLMQQFGTGIRTVHSREADNKSWIGLFDDNRWIAEQFTVGGSNLPADQVNIYLRKVGAPGDVFAEIWTEDSSLPDAVFALATDSLDKDDLKLPITYFHTFDLSAAADLTSATNYWVVVRGSGDDDNEASHWEIGIDKTVTTSKISSDGASWNDSTFGMLYRLTDTDIEREWHFFRYRELEHAIDHRDDDVTSVMLVNGWRGLATSIQAVGTFELEDTNQNWTVDELAGLRVRVIDSDGKGQEKTIVSNTSDTITIQLAWKIALAVTSEFVVYGGAKWNDSGVTLGGPAVDVLSTNDIIYVCYGDLSGDNVIESMQYDSAAGGDYQIRDDGTNRANFMEFHTDPENGPEVWVVQSDENHIHASDVKDFGTNLALTGVGDVSVGTDDYKFTDLISMGSKLYAMKENHPYLYDAANAQAIPDVTKMAFMPNDNNGKESIVHDIYDIFPYGEYYLAQKTSTVFNDISPAQKGEGPLLEELGAPSGLISHPGGIIMGIDAGHDNKDDGVSTVIVLEDSLLGFHTIFSAFDKNKRIRNIYWQINHGKRPKLWVSINGEMMYQEWPLGYRPLKDTGVKYMHETTVMTSVINFNTYGVKKFLETISLHTQNFGPGVEAEIYYRLDNDIEKDTDNWIFAGNVSNSPIEFVKLGVGDVTEIQFLIVMRTETASTPPLLNSFVVKGFNRVPVRSTLKLGVVLDSDDVDYLGNDDVDPGHAMKALMDFADSTEVVRMRSTVPRYNNIRVVVQPFGATQQYVDEESEGILLRFSMWILADE